MFRSTCTFSRLLKGRKITLTFFHNYQKPEYR